MTPLIDVLLVLLVIFMVVTPVLTKGMTSELPRPATEVLSPGEADQQLVLTHSADGRLLLNREELTWFELPSRLRGVLAERGGHRLMFLDADDTIPYGQVVRLMDICRDAGAEEIGIVLESLN